MRSVTVILFFNVNLFRQVKLNNKMDNDSTMEELQTLEFEKT